MIEVEKKDKDEFKVIVTYEGVNTEHNVSLDDAYYQKLTGGKITKEELIKRSFEFLLMRESNQSILSSFDLNVINKYFPEYEDETSLYSS
ncbi:hypothetical protein KAX08_05010 [candidate division WOR-3 bacterium]|nr:hypothetical protein [candidate division WOR-3 bacterium]